MKRTLDVTAADNSAIPLNAQVTAVFDAPEHRSDLGSRLIEKFNACLSAG